MKQSSLKPQFVEFIPEALNNGVLYISMPYATATHLCCCGCGKEVVTPFTPTDWWMTFDGAVSIHPSIGNWSFECRSHYWIKANSVKWSGDMEQWQIEAGRARDKQAKARHYSRVETHQQAIPEIQQATTPASKDPPPTSGWLATLRQWWNR